MDKKNIIAFIPARQASSRFPGKPLVDIEGLPMIEHVRRRALLSHVLDDVYVATCDQEISDVVKKSGGKVIMTASSHERCTDRVEEAVHETSADIVVIIQGDQPLFVPDSIDLLVQPILEDKNIFCSNVVSIIRGEDKISSSSVVKAILNQAGDIMYYSRSPIPYRKVSNEYVLYQQTGVAAFTRASLNLYSKLLPTPLEKLESIDFLRILEHGYRIRGVLYHQEIVEVDYPSDMEKVKKILCEDPIQKKIALSYL